MTTAPGRAGWRISSYSSNGESCVDVDFTRDGAEIRHSKAPTGPSISFTPTEWSAWLQEVLTDELANSNGGVRVEVVPEGWVVHAVRNDASLSFTHDEIIAFRAGVVAGEFDRDAVLAELAPLDAIS
ncbi:DUF397 domain-containing protein [Lentzea sp. NPDC092896]|uniref:DUF397 domain-containing protein n=1 Tax=Lentzea sp. NPDC092896 TaxID=3364127 RepID=UPI00380CE0E5